jgi:very-short-patch-repair endonuclease
MGQRGSSRGRVPKVPLPPLPTLRNPPGINVRDISVRTKTDFPGVGDYRELDPVGDVPPDIKGRFPNITKPEWGVWLGLLKNGLKPDLDFVYQNTLMGTGVSYYSTVDFMLPEWFIAIEVQGEFWHYFESERLFRDRERFQQLTNHGINLIFIDEEDALTRPKWIVQEALAMRDHSKLAKRI